MELGIVKILFVVSFALLVLFALLGIYLHYNLLFLLREKHLRKWEELGRPTLVKNNTIKNNIAVLNFLRKKEYIKMSDGELTKISVFLRNFIPIYLTLFVIVLFLFLIYLKKIQSI